MFLAEGWRRVQKERKVCTLGNVLGIEFRNCHRNFTSCNHSHISGLVVRRAEKDSLFSLCNSKIMVSGISSLLQ